MNISSNGMVNKHSDSNDKNNHSSVAINKNFSSSGDNCKAISNSVVEKSKIDDFVYCPKTENEVNCNPTTVQIENISPSVTAVLKRVTALEDRLNKTKRKLRHGLMIIKEKDQEIIKLKEQIKHLEQEKENTSCKKPPTENISKLLEITQSLNTRITTIEDLLLGGSCYSNYESEFDNYCNMTLDQHKLPDLDLIIQRVNDLNLEAGEVHICEKTKQGATFQNCKIIDLTFYKNGMQLEGHPFHDYAHPRSYLFIKDIIEGYFPSELQSDYPRGVIFNVVDKRNTMYTDPKNKKHGYRLDFGNSFEEVNTKRTMRIYDTLNEEIEKERNINSENTVIQLTDFRRENRNKSNIKKMFGNTWSDDKYKSYHNNDLDNPLLDLVLPDITIKDGYILKRKELLEKIEKQQENLVQHKTSSKPKHLNPEAKVTSSCVQLKIRSVNGTYYLSMNINDKVSKLRSYLPEELRDCYIMHYKDSSNTKYLMNNKSTLKENGIFKNSVIVLHRKSR